MQALTATLLSYLTEDYTLILTLLLVIAFVIAIVVTLVKTSGQPREEPGMPSSEYWIRKHWREGDRL
jgi:hypothetical protein